MAVELEKIAELLENAYEEISRLEEQNFKLKEENESLQILKKEASKNFFEADNEDDDIFSMGNVADINSLNNVSADARLEEFLLS